MADMVRYRTDPEYRERIKQQWRESEARSYANPETRERKKEQVRCQMCSYRKWWYDARDILGFDKCAVCGSTENTHIHHVDDAKKSFKPSAMTRRCPSTDRLLLYISELKKCIPLCQHCHNDAHAKKNPERQEKVAIGLVEFILRSL